MSVCVNYLKKNAANGMDKCALLPMKTSMDAFSMVFALGYQT